MRTLHRTLVVALIALLVAPSLPTFAPPSGPDRAPSPAAASTDLPLPAKATRAALADVPLWYVGDSWSYWITIYVEGESPDPNDPNKIYGLKAHLVADVTYTVAGVELVEWNGTSTYVYNVTMDGTIITKEGTDVYSWARVSGITTTDVMTFLEGSGSGFSWQRVSDLATVRNDADVHVQTDDPLLNGFVDAVVNNQNFPPEELYDFPLYQGDAWHLGSNHSATIDYTYEVHVSGVVDEGPTSDTTDGSYLQNDEAQCLGTTTVNPSEDETSRDKDGDGNPNNDGAAPGMDQDFPCIHVKTAVPIPNSTPQAYGYKNYYYAPSVRSAVYFTAENFALQKTENGIEGEVKKASAVLTAFTDGSVGKTPLPFSCPPTSVPGGFVNVSGTAPGGSSVDIQSDTGLVTVQASMAGTYWGLIQMPEQDGTPESASGATEGVDLGSVGVVVKAGSSYGVATVRLYPCDLSLSDLALVGVEPGEVLVAGRPYTLRVKVHNGGAGSVSGGVTVNFTANGAPVGSAVVDTVYSGSFENAQIQWSPSSGGSHTLRAVVDPADDFLEDRENNNEATLEVTVNNPPTIALAANPKTHVQTYEPFSLDASPSSDPEGGPISFAWEMGDGSVYTDAQISHYYEQDGNYTISLNVTDSVGASAARNWTISVQNRPPEISLLYGRERFAASNQDLFFDASASSDRDGDVTSFVWEFGDGETATGPTTSHAWTAEGNYQVRLTLTDDDGAQNTTTIAVEIADKPPELTGIASDIPAGSSALPKTYVKFTLIGAKCYVLPQHTEWDLNYDGANFTVDKDTGALSYLVYEFPLVGTYTVAARIRDGRDRMTGVVQVTVEIDIPNAVGPTVDSVTANGQTGTVTVDVGDSVLFSGEYTKGDQNVNSTEWHFGDGTTEPGEEVLHAFTAPGTYTVTFRAIDLMGMFGEGTVTVVVKAKTSGGGGTNPSNEDGTNTSSGGGTNPPQSGSETTTSGKGSASSPWLWILIAAAVVIVIVVVVVLVLRAKKGSGGDDSAENHLPAPGHRPPAGQPKEGAGPPVGPQDDT